ncbi:MAG: hypothetical protein QOH67_1953 [Hyphomicrobiales bacterium]|jgi:predicted XRE-type DNA-binding protein|nr:hypothetical protein [Hyphomicrobiales bacterium]
MASKATTQRVVRGGTNVFADLGYPDAYERQTKLRLAHAINMAIGEQRLAQLAAARRLSVSQPKISARANYHPTDCLWSA